VIDPVSHVTGRPGESRWANVEFCWTTTTRPHFTWQDRPVSTAPSTRLRAASAGAAAAAIWALQEPFDQRLAGCDYSDVAVLGKAVTRGPGWTAAGFGLHTLNEAAFGLAFYEARRLVPIGSRKLALGLALTEHVCLYPLCAVIDRYHPARGEPGIPPLLTNPRAFLQATWRHALFGALLGRLAEEPAER
jgi:hypothetical protein